MPASGAARVEAASPFGSGQSEPRDPDAQALGTRIAAATSQSGSGSAR